MKRKKTPKELSEEDEELSPEWKRELRSRIADSDNPVRYVIYSDILSGGRWRLFFNVSDDTFCDQIATATLFKRENVALGVAKACSDGRKRDLLIAKITTKNGKRRVLKYEKRKHQTKN